MSRNSDAADTGYSAQSAALAAGAMALHDSLRRILDRLFPALDGARACGRALGLRRNLGWQLFTIAHTTDYAGIVRALPQRHGWEIAVRALEVRQATKDELRVLSKAVSDLRGLLDAPGGSRSTLRAAAAGALDSAAQRRKAVRMRAAATRANAHIHGIKVRMCVSSIMIGPVRPRGVVDIVAATTIDGLCRTRPGSAWPIYHTLEAIDDKRACLGVMSGRYRAVGIPPLAADLSTAGAAEKWLRLRSDGKTQFVELRDRGAEHANPLRLAFLAFLPRSGSVLRSETESRLLFLMNAPTERGVVEVWFHQSVSLRNDPSALLLSSPNLDRRVLSAYEIERLPLEKNAEPVKGSKIVGISPEAGASHTELLRRGSARLGAAMEDFRGFRLDVTHPPWMSMLALAFDCEPRPKPEAPKLEAPKPEAPKLGGRGRGRSREQAPRAGPA